jgi:hypothetical protein
MKKYLVSLLYSLIIVSCTHKEEVQFKLPDVPYATSGEAVVSKKEFKFPTVPYAK